MRIAFVVKDFPALSETFILNQIVGLIRLGHEVDIYAYRPRGSDPAVHPAVNEYCLLDRTIYFRPPSARIGYVVSRLRQVAPRRRMPGLVVRTALDCLRLRRPDPLLAAISVPVDRSYDIVQCHFGHLGIVALALKRIGAARRLVVTFHAYELTKLLNRRQAALYRLVSRHADLLTPVSDRWAEVLKGLGCAPEKIAVHRMGVDTDQLVFRERKLSGPLRLITVARLVEKKGVGYAIEAVARLQSSLRIPIELTVIGDGPLRGHLEGMVERCNLGGVIRLLGWCQQGEVHRYLYDAHLMLLPSITASDGDQEGIPVSLMEAMATGLPVITTRHSGIPELVVDGKSGILVPEGDVDALVRSVIQFVSAPQLFGEIGNAGRRVVERSYSITSLNRRLVEIYDGLLESKDQQ